MPAETENVMVPGTVEKPTITSCYCWGEQNCLWNSTVRQFYCCYQLNDFACRWLVLFHRTGLSLNHCFGKTCVDDSLALIAVLTETVAGSLVSPYYRHVPVLFAQDGKVCSWNKDEAQVLMARVIVRTPRMLSTNPALA